MLKRGYLAIFLLIVLLSAGLYIRHRINTVEPPSATALLRSQMIDLTGVRQPVKQWRGRILVVNFWASWCIPCKQEIPGFVVLQREFADRNVQFIGITLDDKPPVQQFALRTGINYPLLMGDLESLVTARDMGDRTGELPFTAVIDASGQVIATHAGEFPADELRRILSGLTLKPKPSL